MKKKIPVTRSLLPDRKRFHEYIDRILDSGWLTNRGECVRELERRLAEYLGVRNIVVVSNGTLALQVAYKALGLKGKVITSPFTFIATASSARWEGLEVVFADIDPETLNITPETVEPLIDDQVSAVVPVHVFGNPCDLEGMEALARHYGVRLIFDAAHAFGVQYKGSSVLRWGDASILSFHATKLFHTAEGGALIVEDEDLCNRVRKMINFGITGPETIECLGINAKMNEFQAALGVCLLDEVDIAIMRRKKISELYDVSLKDVVRTPRWSPEATRNYSYYPVLFDSESTLKRVQTALNKHGVVPRRYFYPSLDTLSFLVRGQWCPIARDVASRVLCLPLFSYMTEEDVQMICRTILDSMGE